MISAMRTPPPSWGADSRHYMPTASAGNSAIPAWLACQTTPACARARRSLVVRGQGAAAAADSFVRAAYGETLKVVGSSGSMGAWDAAAAPEMCWADGHIWALDLDLPEHAGFEYKIVHMHCNGMSWESCQNRLFQAGPGLPEQAALDISCAFNYPELTIVQLAALDTLPSLEGKDPWDPAARGLPADLTEELSKLEPSAVAAAKSWAEVQQDAPIFQTEAAVAVERAVVQDAAVMMGPAGEHAAAVQAEEVSKGEGFAAAAGAVALALGAGVVILALAIDLTDVAVASAVLAAGATFLPAKDAEDARHTVSDVFSGSLNATEAIARGFGLKSHVEQRAEREAARKAASEAANAATKPEVEEGTAGTAVPSKGALDTNSAATGRPSAGVLPSMMAMSTGSAEKSLADSMADTQKKPWVPF
ncbi:hypothetical protein CVIRNUC_011164 [Coccomyxa viridis]|uniref:CBM20 domain-containing protein n=1 Tax=Coccomyxa viridis TaxID=1274662 RepID=A0AAV1IMK8_9CHLO|nr:hypothetical protein CVIRNUC_011164 [Coccomyxa viridis]